MTPDAPKTEVKKPTAAKKPTNANGEISKSDAIRKVANAMKAKGEKPRPKTIMEIKKIKIEDLVRAKKVAAQLGGVEKALAAIKALKDFEG
jgi:hypothetical protein